MMINNSDKSTDIFKYQTIIMMNVFTVMSVMMTEMVVALRVDGYNNENVVIFDNDSDESVVTH